MVKPETGQANFEEKVMRFASPLSSFSSAYSDEQRLTGAGHYSFKEVDWIARNELVVHLSDIVLRRTTLAIEGRLKLEGLREIAGLAGAALGWNAERIASEIEDVVIQLEKFHGQTLANRMPAAGPEQAQHPASA